MTTTDSNTAAPRRPLTPIRDQALGRAATLLTLALFLVAATLSSSANAAEEPKAPWRVRIKEAAVVNGPVVLLGDIGLPLGELDPGQWEMLAAIELFPAPPEKRPMYVNKDKLEQALALALGERSRLCLLPSRLALQRGGAVLLQDDLASNVVKALTPLATSLGGRASFRDHQLPPYLFLSDAMNIVTAEATSMPLKPGRVALLLKETSPDGKVLHKISCGIFLDLWKEVPVAAKPLNRGVAIKPGDVVFAEKNSAYLPGEIWDGRGGPWRIKSPVGTGQPLMASNLEPLPLVRRGETVNLVFEGVHVRLTVPAEALSDGGIGESITVRNLQSKKQVLGKVRDGQTVVVH